MDDYLLVRKRGQKSLRMHFKDSGVLVVSAPYHTPDKEIQNFIESNSAWIEKHKKIIPDHQFENGELISFWGKDRKLIVIKGKSSVSVTDDQILVCTVHPENKKSIQKCLYNFYSKMLLEYINTEAPRWLFPLNIKMPDFEICNAKTRWGCCYSTKYLIKISAITACLDESLIQMILVHELCHLRYHNHQKEFWMLLRSAMPDVDEREKELKAFDKTGKHRNLF